MQCYTSIFRFKEWAHLKKRGNGNSVSSFFLDNFLYNSQLEDTFSQDTFLLFWRAEKSGGTRKGHRRKKRGSRFVPASSPKDLFVTQRDKKHPCQVRRWSRPNLRERPPRPCQGLRRFQGRPERGHKHSRRGTRTSWQRPLSYLPK